MEASEFMIGNYIECYGEICEITLVGTEGISAKYDGENGKCSVKFSNPTLQPIPLTKQWLRNFKFGEHFTSDPQERNASKAHYIDDFKIHQLDEEIDSFGYGGNDYEFIDVKYVHQLQNIYFTMTGKQLLINPTQHNS